MEDLTRPLLWMNIKQTFREAKPFNHVVIDDFFHEDIALDIANEFPDFHDKGLGEYDHTFGRKKVTNSWDRFGKYTYQAFSFLGREYFIDKMKYLLDEQELWLDYGLNGGGLHMHGTGGALNVHLDYNLHPKLDEQRKLNIIIYMTPNWNPEWGGGLEIWSAKEDTGRPKEHVATIENRFNRAVIFDTTQNSWHGFQNYLTCPEGVYRRSLAAYFVRPAREGTDPRGKALFVAREDQKNDPEFERLALERAGLDTASKFYVKG